MIELFYNKSTNKNSVRVATTENITLNGLFSIDDVYSYSKYTCFSI